MESESIGTEREMRRTCLVTCATLACLLAFPVSAAYATDGYFLHGVGAINSAMGGAGVARPQSLLAAYYLNPAGLMAFDGTRVEFGFEMFKPDRTVSSDATAIGFGSGTTTSKSDFVPIPAMGFSTKLNNEKVALGVGGLAIGGFGVDYPASTSNPILAPRPFGFGQIYSNYGLIKLSPTVAFAATEKFWLGISGIVNWASLAVDPLPVGAPAVDPGPDGTPGTQDDRAFFSSGAAADGAFGFGAQVGAIYNVNDMISIGASFQTPQWFEDFEFNTTFANPNLPNFGTPRTITFNLDMPMFAAAGVAVSPAPNLLLAGDFRYIFYETADGFDIEGPGVFNTDGSVKAFGWENIASIHVGAQYRANDRVSLRAGYNWSENPIPDSLSFINTPAPGIVQHHLTVGIGIRPTRRFEVSAAYYHAFGNSGTGTFLNPFGAIPGTTVTNELREDSFLIQFSFATRGSI